MKQPPDEGGFSMVDVADDDDAQFFGTDSGLGIHRRKKEIKIWSGWGSGESLHS
jgi:hypothetical protein